MSSRIRSSLCSLLIIHLGYTISWCQKLEILIFVSYFRNGATITSLHKRYQFCLGYGSSPPSWILGGNLRDFRSGGRHYVSTVRFQRWRQFVCQQMESAHRGLRDEGTGFFDAENDLSGGGEVTAPGCDSGACSLCSPCSGPVGPEPRCIPAPSLRSTVPGSRPAGPSTPLGAH